MSLIRHFPFLIPVVSDWIEWEQIAQMTFYAWTLSFSTVFLLPQHDSNKLHESVPGAHENFGNHMSSKIKLFKQFFANTTKMAMHFFFNLALLLEFYKIIQSKKNNNFAMSPSPLSKCMWYLKNTLAEPQWRKNCNESISVNILCNFKNTGASTRSRNRRDLDKI